MKRRATHVAPAMPAKTSEQAWTKLLERESFLQELAVTFDEVAAGMGRTVLTSGEAGIGKTSLIEHFARQHENSARVLWGACEALFTPRPLGPVYDIAFQTRGELLELLEAEASRQAIFSAFLAELHRCPSPTIVILEDLHWADEATLDLVKFLGRRIHRTRAILILTYRDDVLGVDHRLRLVLGDLPHAYTKRLQLEPLSEAAVERLASEAGRACEDLHATTGGNPFFVAEVLASEEGRVPASVRDAVLARVARLSPAAQDVLELVAVSPTRTERWLLEELLAPDLSVLEECSREGMLRLGAEMLAFRHELARRTIADALTAPRRQTLHAQVLEALATREHVEAARLVHHADQAGDGTAVLRFAHEAARHAAALGAHREAASHYETALRYAGALSQEERSGLLEAWSYECYLTHQLEKALQARHAALELWQHLRRQREVGLSLHWISKLNWFLGKRKEAVRYAENAMAILENLPPGYELAYAYCNRANLHMLHEETIEAIRFASHAIELVEQFGIEKGFPTETLINSLNSIGVSLLMDQEESWRWGTDSAITPPGLNAGRAELEKSLELALQHDYDEHAARAYTNLACQAVIHRDYAQAARYLEAGIAYCHERDLDSWRLVMTAYRSRMHFEKGAWDAAADDARRVLDHSSAYSIAKLPALVILGRLGVRRGEASAAPLLEEAARLAKTTEDIQHMAPVAAARAEAAWLSGNMEAALAEAQSSFKRVLSSMRPWALGELGFWMWRSGGLARPPEGAALPFAHHMAGNWRAAADAWKRIGCLYEEAMALADGDEAAQFAALGMLERLGADPAAKWLRRKMQERGVRGVPRGPRPSTRDNPYELTARQMAVLGLLAEGLTNAEIGGRLFISSKTVDHHVSAIFSKLEVGSRTEAASFALQHGLLPELPSRLS